MGPDSAIRPGEVAVAPPPANDAGLLFIGRIHTPWSLVAKPPHRGDLDGPVCRIEVFEPWLPALTGMAQVALVEVFYWLHLARRDLVLQCPARDGVAQGTFALRSPVRPNPIGTSVVRLLAIEGPMLVVRGLDCLDGTPLLDLKPDRSNFRLAAPG